MIVNLRTGKAISGVLTSKAGPLLELREAKFHEPGIAAPVPMDGAVLIERSNVDFMQVVGEV